jgi:hypothetical protein
MASEGIQYKGWRIDLLHQGAGWKALVFRPSSLLHEKPVPTGLDRRAVILKAKTLIDQCLATGLSNKPQFKACRVPGPSSGTGGSRLELAGCPVVRRSLAREADLLRQKESLLQEQELLREECDHRLLNGLQIVVSLLSLQSRAAVNPDVAANRVATLRRVLINWGNFESPGQSSRRKLNTILLRCPLERGLEFWFRQISECPHTRAPQ